MLSIHIFSYILCLYIILKDAKLIHKRKLKIEIYSLIDIIVIIIFLLLPELFIIYFINAYYRK